MGQPPPPRVPPPPILLEMERWNVRPEDLPPRKLAEYQRAVHRHQKAELERQRVLHGQKQAEEFEAAQERRVDELTSVLESSLRLWTPLTPATLKESWNPASFEPGNLVTPTPRPEPEEFEPEMPRMIGRLVPGARERWASAQQDSQENYQQAFAYWHEAEINRERLLAQREELHHQLVERERVRVISQHEEVDRLIAGLVSRTPTAVEAFFSAALGRSAWPQGFLKDFTVAFDPDSRLLTVDYALPGIEVVPDLFTYTYIKTRDEIKTKPQAVSRRRNIYAQIISNSALRLMHEITQNDDLGATQTVTLNCYVDGIDSGTGHPTRPCIVSVSTERERFMSINLAQVDSKICLERLAALVSPDPAGLVSIDRLMPPRTPEITRPSRPTRGDRSDRSRHHDGAAGRANRPDGSSNPAGFVFISYARTDQKYVDRLAKKLQRAGIKFWVDKAIEHGTRWPKVVEERVDSCAAMVVVMSPESDESEWVGRELTRAEDRGKPVFPLLLNGDVFFRLNQTQHEDVTSGGLPTSKFIERLRASTQPSSNGS